MISDAEILDIYNNNQDIFYEICADILEDSPIKETAKYKAFQQKYFYDFAGFIRDCVEWGDDNPAPYQLEIANGVLEYGRYTFRGPRGLGKTAVAALIILAFALTRDGKDWKIATTASNGDQLTLYLWPEIHKWAGMLKWDVIGRSPFHAINELQERNLKLSTGRAFAIIPGKTPKREGEKMEGVHASHLLYVVDEAKLVPDSVFDSMEGAFASTGESLVMVMSTPGPQMGRFYDIHRRKKGFERWKVRHVTQAEAIAAGRITSRWVNEMKTRWGTDGFLYLNQAEGEFAADSTHGVIPFSLVSQSNIGYDRWKSKINHLPPPDCLGVDIGDTRDDSVIAFYCKPSEDNLYILLDKIKDRLRNNQVIHNGIRDYIELLKESESYKISEVSRILLANLEKVTKVKSELQQIKTLIAPYKCLSAMRHHVITKLEVVKKTGSIHTMQVVGVVRGYLDEYPNCTASIDSIAIGVGPVHRLQELGYQKRVITFDVREKTHKTDSTGKYKFANKRGAMWWLGRESLSGSERLLLPENDDLTAELTAVEQKSHDSGNEIRIEAKKDIRRRLGRSTDSADAVWMARFGTVLGKTGGDPLDLAAFIANATR